MSRAFVRSELTWIVVLLLIATAQLLHRTPPVQQDSFFFDFSNAYSASRAWIAGQNPYNLDQVYHAWEGSNHGPYLGTANPKTMHLWAAVHPPSTLLLLSPFAALNAVPGHLLWMACGLLLLTATFAALFSLGRIDDTKSRLLLVACAMASAPVESAIESGQPALIAGSLVILAVWAFSKDRLTLAGVLLGLATALKVQVGAPFIVYYLFIRQWRVGTLASVLFTVATMAAIARMQSLGISTWWTDWHHNIAATLDLGHVNDPRPGGPWRNDMVNLQTLVDVVFHRQIEIDAVVLLLYLPMLVTFVTRIRPSRAAGRDLLALSLVALLSMLPIYRRLYDGVLLLMLLTWAISRLETRQRGLAIAVLAMLGEFLIPIDLIPFVIRRTHLFDSMISSMWWQGLIVPHHAWGLLVLTAGTLYVLYRRTESIAVIHQPSGAGGTSNRIAASPHSI